MSSDTITSPERLLEVIRTQGDVVRLGPDLGAVMALGAERACTLTGAAGAVVELAEGDDMVYRATAGSMQPHLGMHLSRANSISGLCVREAKPLHSADTETDPRVDRAACRRIGVRSMGVVPLLHDNHAVGVLKVVAAHANAFSTADINVIGLMSDLIGAAMFHAAQHESSELFLRATHDARTGLPNRALFYDRLRQSLQRAQRSGERVAVLYLDMDGLKQINDELGHRAGDSAIRECAQRLRGVARMSDTVARLGGDEFGLLYAPTTDRAGVDAQIARLEAVLSTPLEFEQRQLAIGASVGAALFPDDAVEPDQLVEQADHAMYAAKRTRRS